MTRPLSPAAQAVLDHVRKGQAAAALRALARHEGESVYTYEDGKFGVVREDRILAIAAELEGVNQ